MEEASRAGASQYAPARLQQAEAALQDMRRKVGDKDCRGALSAASDAADWQAGHPKGRVRVPAKVPPAKPAARRQTRQAARKPNYQGSEGG